MKRYYIKALSCVCYDKTGITFPDKYELDLTTALKTCNCKNIRWAKQFGWKNQPRVLCFDVNEKDVNLINKSIQSWENGLLVTEKW
jgi:hypothetical protein